MQSPPRIIAQPLALPTLTLNSLSLVAAAFFLAKNPRRAFANDSEVGCLATRRLSMRVTLRADQKANALAVARCWGLSS